MGSLAGLLLVAVSVGLSNFAASIGIGLSGVSARTRLRVGLAFGAFEALMPVAGLLLGDAARGRLGGVGHYAGGALLVLTGAYTIWRGRTPRAPEAGMATRSLLLTALALSVDNLVVGFAIGVYQVNILLAAVLIGIVSVLMSLIGLEIGGRLGPAFEEWSDEVGGAILILLGLGLGLGLVR